MAELIKPWQNGGNLYVTYEGRGPGPAVVSSDVNKGAERIMNISTVDASRSVIVVRTVRQAAGQTSQETYTRLTHIECNGQQYIDLGYIVKEDDIIEMDYISTSATSADKMLFGCYNAEGSVWVSLYGSTAYCRFGSTSSRSITNATGSYRLKLQKGTVTIGPTSGAVGFAGMPDVSIYLFAARASDGDPYAYGYCRCSEFKITDNNGEVMRLLPFRRDSDGVVGMLDVITGQFYESAQEPFIAGSEAKITDGYEIIEAVTFDANNIFEACIINSSYRVEIQWQKASASGSQYLYGYITSPHTKSVTAYIGSSASWRWGSSAGAFNTNNTNIHYGVVVNGKFTVDLTSKSVATQNFTTDDTLIVGGYRSSGGVPNYQYEGKIYFFRVIDADGNYVVDWIPCKRLSDGVEGFWDCVTQTFVEPI